MILHLPGSGFSVSRFRLFTGPQGLDVGQRLPGGDAEPGYEGQGIALSCLPEQIKGQGPKPGSEQEAYPALSFYQPVQGYDEQAGIEQHPKCLAQILHDGALLTDCIFKDRTGSPHALPGSLYTVAAGPVFSHLTDAMLDEPKREHFPDTLKKYPAACFRAFLIAGEADIELIILLGKFAPGTFV